MNTKTRSYAKSRSFAATQAGRIFQYLLSNQNLTRQDLSKNLGIALASVCGRVSELIAMGLVEVSGEALGSAGSPNEILNATKGDTNE